MKNTCDRLAEQLGKRYRIIEGVTPSPEKLQAVAEWVNAVETYNLSLGCGIELGLSMLKYLANSD